VGIPRQNLVLVVRLSSRYEDGLLRLQVVPPLHDSVYPVDRVEDSLLVDLELRAQVQALEGVDLVYPVAILSVDIAVERAGREVSVGD